MASKDIDELTQDPLDENMLPLSQDPTINRRLQKIYNNVAPPITTTPQYGEGFDEPLIEPNVPLDISDDDRDLLLSSAELGNLTQEDINELKASDQTIFGNIYRGGVRTTAKAIQEIAKIPGLVGGGIGWVFEGMDSDDTGIIFNNAYSRGIDDAFNRVIYENESAGLKTFVPKRVKEGSLVDNLGSTAFWATEGADAVGFFASMFVPGAVISKAGAGAKIAGLAGKLGTGRKLLTPLEKTASLSKLAGNIDNILGIAANTVIESGAEASGIYQSVKDQLIAQGEDPDIANRIASDKAAKTFNTNLLLLAGPNAVQMSMLGKAFNPKVKNLLPSIEAQGRRLTGLKVFKSPEFIKDLGKKFIKGSVWEGLVEEGGQSAIEKYYTNQGLKLQEDEKGFVNSLAQFGNDMAGIAKQYATSAFQDTEMDKAMLLGGLLGGLGGGVGAYRNYQAAQDKIYGYEGRKTKLGKLFPRTAKKGLNNILKENLIVNYKTLGDVVKLDDKDQPIKNKETGQYEYNPKLLEELGEDKMRGLTLMKIAEDSELKGDKESFELYTNLNDYNVLKDFLEDEDLVEYAKEHFIPNKGDELVKSREEYRAKMSNDHVQELSDENISKWKQDLIKKVDVFKQIYDDVNNRHDYETQFEYPLDKKNEYDTFMSRVKNAKIQSRINWNHSNERIAELEDRTNNILSNNEFKKTTLKGIKKGDVVKYKGELSEALGDNKFRELNTNKEFEIKTAKEEGKEIPVDIEKLDATKPDIKEVLDNNRDIQFNKEVINEAKNDLNVIYNNKELKKIFNKELEKLDFIAKQVEFKDTFKPNTYWEDNTSGERFKLQYEGTSPVLYREQLDEGEYKYVQEVPLNEDLLKPNNFKNAFTEVQSPNIIENTTTEETTSVEEEELDTIEEVPTNETTTSPTVVEETDIEGLPTTNISDIPGLTPSVTKTTKSVVKPKGKVNVSDLDTTNNPIDQVDSNPEKITEKDITQEEPIDTSLETIEVPEKKLKRHPLNSFNTTANNKDISTSGELSGDLNAFKADKVASDLPIYNGNYSLKAFKPSQVFPSMREYFNEVAEGYSFDNTVYLALVDKEGNLVGTNEDYTQLNKLDSNNLSDYSDQITKDVIFWSLREVSEKYLASNEDVWFVPDPKTQMDVFMDLPGFKDKLEGVDNKKVNKDTGYTEQQTFALNLFDAFMKDEIRKHENRRKVIESLIRQNKDVVIKITGHSKGIPSTINKTGLDSASKALAAVENTTEDKLIEAIELKIADKNFIDFGNGNKIPSQKGRTYGYNTESGHIYDLQPRKFNENEVNNLINLFRYYIDRLNQIYKNKDSQLDANDFVEAEKFEYLNQYEDKTSLQLGGNEVSIFGYLNSIIHNKYLQQKKLTDNGRGLVLSSRQASGSRKNIDFNQIAIFSEELDRYVLNPDLINKSNTGALQTELQDLYYQVKSIKVNNEDDMIFDLNGYDTKNGVLKGSLQNYKEFMLKKVLQSDILPPIIKEMNIHPYFGGGTSTITMPTFNSVYINLDLTPFDKVIDKPKDESEVGLTQTTEETDQKVIDAKLRELDKDINEEPFRLLYDKTNYIQENFNEFKLWFNEKFPQFGDSGLKIISGLLEKGIFGKVANYSIVLDNAAEIGTGYHEAFHMVTHYLLSPKERESLYSEWKDINKDMTLDTYKGESKPVSEFTNKEIEEQLAEDFREYKLAGSKLKYPSVKESLFKRILRYIRNIFRPSINKTFARIDSGYYRNRNIRYNDETSFREPRYFESDNPIQSSIEFYKEIMDATNVYFFDEIRKSERSFASFFNKDNNSDLINKTYKRVYELFKLERDAVKDSVKTFTERLKNNPSRQNELKLERAEEQLEHYNFLLSQFETPKTLEDFKRKHANQLREFGLADKFVKGEIYESKKFNEEDILEQTGQTEDTKDIVWNLSDLSVKFDAKYNAQKSIKLLVGTIPQLKYNKNTKNYDRVRSNILGTPTTVDFGGMFNAILNNLTGIKTLPEVINKLSNLKKDIPSLEYFFTEDGLNLNALLEGQFGSATKFNEAVQFAQTFAKTENNFSISVLNQDGKRSFVDANLQAKRRGIRARWRSNTNAKAINPNDNTINKEGIYNPSKFKDTYLDTNAPNTSFDFLEKIGIIFNDRDKIIDNGYAGEVWRISDYILKAIQKGNQVNVFSIEENTDFGGNVNQLIDIEYESNLDLNESSHLGSDGESRYNHSLNSSISTILDNVNKFQGKNAWNKMVQFYPHLNSEKVDWIKNSILLKKGGLLFNNNGDRYDNTNLILHTAEALRESDGGTAEDYSKLSKADRMADTIDRILKGQYNLIRPADKSLERFISLGTKKGFDTTEALNIFTNYLVDDLINLKSSRTNPNEQVWKNYKDNNDANQGIFIDIIRNFSEAPTWVENTFNPHVEDNSSVADFIAANRSKIKAAINKYLNDSVNNLFVWLQDNKLLEKVGDKYKSKAITFSDKTNEFDVKTIGNMLKDVIVKDLIMNTEQLKLIFGNPNYYGKIADFFKRTGSFPGTRKVLISDFITDSFIEEKMKRTDGAENLVDNVVEALVYDEDSSRSRKKAIIKQIVFDDPTVFDEIFGKVEEETDGYSMISFDEYREFLFRAGDWSWGENSLEDLYQYEMQNYYGPNLDKEGYLTTSQFNKIFNRKGWDGIVKSPEDGREITSRPTPKINMLKPLYVGPYAEKGFVPGISKTSFGVIYPSLVKGRPNLEKMMHFMRKNKIGVVSFASANKGITTKLNQKGGLNKLYTKEGQLNLDNLYFEDTRIGDKIIPANAVTQNTYYEFWGLQLDTGFKNKDKVIYGTQMMKQILSYIYADGKIKDEFSDLSDQVEEYKQLNAERLNLGKKQLLEDLDIQVKEVTNDRGQIETQYVINDLDKFKNKLKNIANERGMDDNTYDSINFIEEELGVDILLNRNKFESAIFSLNDALVIKQKRRGGAYYQQPSTLYEKSGLRTYDKESGTLKSSDDLKMYDITKDKDGNTVVGKMQVILPNLFKGLPKDKIEKLLLEGIAFRIPTQGLASIEAIEIVDFLDESAGDTIILPSAIVKKAGSDYDIDKLNLYIPYYYENNKGEAIYIDNSTDAYTKYEANKKESDKLLSLEEFRKMQVENRITSIQKNIILHPSNYNNLTKSLDDTKDIISKLANEIYELKTGNKRNTETIGSIINRINLVDVSDRFLSSKQAVGITALGSPFHILAQVADLKLAKYDDNGNLNQINLPHNEDSNGNILLSGELDKSKGNIAEILRQWISEAVDAAKDPRMFDLNVNLETLNVVEFLTMAGVPTNHLMYFLNQPIILDYIHLKSVGKAKFMAVNHKPLTNREGNIIKNKRTKEIITTPETMSNKEIKDVIVAKYGGKPVEYDSSIKSLKESISRTLQSSEFNKKQVAILLDYLRYKDMANTLTNAVQGASWDTNSAGKSVPELLMRLRSTGITLNKKSVINEELPDNKTKKKEVGPLLINYDKLLTSDNSFVRPYYLNNKNLIEEFAPLFKIALGDKNIRTMLKFMTHRYSTEFSMPKETQVAILNNFITGYLTYNMITKPYNKEIMATEEEFHKAISSLDNQIVKEFNRLFKGGNSVAKRLDIQQEVLRDFQNTTDGKMSRDTLRKKYNYVEEGDNSAYEAKVRFFNKYKDNALLQTLIPNISESADYMDHVVLHNRSRDLLEISKLVDAWNMLLNDQDPIMRRLGLDLVKLLTMQSGVQTSPNNFMNMVPAEIYTKLVKQTMKGRFQEPEAAKRDVFKYYIDYTINNNRDDYLIPGNKNLKNKSNAYPIVKSKIKLKKDFRTKSDADVRKAISQGKIVYEDNPQMQLKKDSEIGINNWLPIFYKISKLSQELNLYGRGNPKLYSSLESEFKYIFEPKTRESITTEIQKSEFTYDKGKENLSDAFNTGSYTNIFNEYNILSINDIDNLSNEQIEEILKKICK